MTTLWKEVAQKKDHESVNSADDSTREDVLVSSKRPSVPYCTLKQMPTKDTLPSSTMMLSLWWYVYDKYNSTNCYMGNGSLNNSRMYFHFGHNTFCSIHNFLNRQNG